MGSLDAVKARTPCAKAFFLPGLSQSAVLPLSFSSSVAFPPYPPGPRGCPHRPPNPTKYTKTLFTLTHPTLRSATARPLCSTEPTLSSFDLSCFHCSLSPPCPAPPNNYHPPLMMCLASATRFPVPKLSLPDFLPELFSVNYLLSPLIALPLYTT